MTHDFSTPEGAILCLEDAYRAKDIEAAIRCKDFRIEAKVLLSKVDNLPPQQMDDHLIGKTAEALELAYRTQMEEGLPDMTGVSSTFSETEVFGESIVVVTEVCSYPDGGISTQRILVAKTDNGWRVLNPID